MTSSASTSAPSSSVLTNSESTAASSMLSHDPAFASQKTGREGIERVQDDAKSVDSEGDEADLDEVENLATKGNESPNSRRKKSSSQKKNKKGKATRKFNYEWIEDTVTQHMSPGDFDDYGDKDYARVASYVKNFAQRNVVNAVGIMTYVDNLETRVQKLQSQLKDARKATAQATMNNEKSNSNNNDDDEDGFVGVPDDADDKNADSSFLRNLKEEEGERLEEGGKEEESNSGSSESARDWILAIEKIRVLTNRQGNQFFSPYDDPWELESESDSDSDDEEDGGCIIQHMYCLSFRGEPTGDYIRIQSPHLQQELRKIMTRGTPDMLESLAENEGVVINSPFYELFQYEQRLQAHCTTLEEPAKSHLNYLLTFLESNRPAEHKISAQIASGSIKEIDVNMLPLLYRPGTKVFVKSKEKDWLAFEIMSLHYVDNRVAGLSLGSLVFNGQGELIECRTDRPIAQPGTPSIKIEDLEYIPADLHRDREDISKALIERGKHYNSYASGPLHKQYTGAAWPRRLISEPLRVVIDVRMAQPMSDVAVVDVSEPIEFCCCRICSRHSERKEYINSGSNIPEYLLTKEVKVPEPDDDTLMLCASEIIAFSLRLKTEKLVELKHLADVAYEEDAWRKLVVSPDYKSLVTSMVKAYLDKQVALSDLVRGKGKGLIVLLHGSPGTGKTLTAECVAEQQRRPLYTITCGNLGTEATELEKNLQDIFDIAVRWDAILLLDEADVFLQERDIQKLKRNALVSVFLREVEYFDGILFLTTNRPGIMDEAFQSRIHLTLSLPDLDAQSRWDVWRLFLYSGRERLTADEEEAMRKIEKWTRNDYFLNGRQIRNYVMTASALAAQKSGSGQPTLKEIKQVLRVSQNFTRYMTDLKGDDQNTIAEQRNLRLAGNYRQDGGGGGGGGNSRGGGGQYPRRRGTFMAEPSRYDRQTARSGRGHSDRRSRSREDRGRRSSDDSDMSD